jgi:uncharacterized damage-inducible protein DinB
MLPSLQTRFDAIESQRRAFIDDLAALAAAQLAFRPAPDAWSLGDVAQHLTLVDAKTTRVLTERRVTGVSRRAVLDVVYRARLLDLLWLTHLRVKMPVKGVAPDPSVTLPETAKRWGDARTALRGYLDGMDETAARAIVYRHPVGGYMDIADTLRFLEKHHEHHLHQVARLKRAAGYPTPDRAA